ncbi:hypothetical protein CC86DRAFT_425064 [Ophiobolus disseminans]|uniref:RING-type domain-containing protein n=1 Tax=Ophiobolus disseminans TaxID=1469910 RepID=A0A6A7AHA8_9PLEO|nr:hypothetical protein CC86DRAFT_425064 [Ophiobolus disseminans]
MAAYQPELEILRGSSRRFGYGSDLSQLPAPTPAMTPVAFIAAHTTVDTTLPVNDECPICLDNYAHEDCLLITGITGCTHHIGQKCLEEMLRTRPAEEKRCPLCRTMWIAAGPLVPVSGMRPRFVHGGPLPSSVGSFRSSAAAARPLQERNPAGDVSINNAISHMRMEMELFNSRPEIRNGSPLAPELINLDSDSDSENYAAEVESFNALTRDIEDVRARARNTQISRSQRRQALRDRTAQTGRGAGQRTDSDDGPVASARNFLRQNPFRQSSQTGIGTAAAPIAIPPSSVLTTAPRPSYPARDSSLRPQTRDTFFGRHDALVNRSPPPRDSSGSRDPRDSPQLIVEVSHTSSASSSPDTITPDEPPAAELPGLDVGSAHRNYLLNQRETALNRREAALNQREIALNTHETRLKHREVQVETQVAIPVLEQRVNMLRNRQKGQAVITAPEQRADALLGIVKKQQKEREDLAEKQKAEMEKVTGRE